MAEYTAVISLALFLEKPSEKKQKRSKKVVTALLKIKYLA
jgi:hypothetical protein